jgi:hypothetical protein
MRLSCLGWTQEMIAKRVGKAQSSVSEIIGNIDTNKFDNFFPQGKSVKEIASMYDRDVQAG